MNIKLFLLPLCLFVFNILSMEESCDYDDMPELIEFESVSQLNEFQEKNGIVVKSPSKTQNPSTPKCDSVDMIILRWKKNRILDDLHTVVLKRDSIEMIKKLVEDKEMSQYEGCQRTAEKVADIKKIIERAHGTLIKPLPEFEDDSFFTGFASLEDFYTYQKIQQGKLNIR